MKAILLSGRSRRYVHPLFRCCSITTTYRGEGPCWILNEHAYPSRPISRVAAARLLHFWRAQETGR